MKNHKLFVAMIVILGLLGLGYWLAEKELAS